MNLIPTPIIKINTANVPRISDPKEIELFKSKYLSNAYLHDGDPEFEDRKKNAKEIQFIRWEWMIKHPEIYVNMLRLSNHPEENIQACLDGRRPLCFTSELLYCEFTRDLRGLEVSLEEETPFKNVRFIQAGSSVAGFSNNPFKGLRDQPSKITDVKKSDVDVVIVAYGVKAFVDKQRALKVELRDYPSTTTRYTPDDMRYGFRDWSIIPPIKDWMSKWKVKMGGGVQITLQEGDPSVPPWEPYILLPP